MQKMWRSRIEFSMSKLRMRIAGRSDDADGRSEVHVVDEPVLERDVRLEGSRSELAGLLAVLRRPPWLSKDDAGAGGRPTFDLQRDVLEGDDLLVTGKRAAKGLWRRDDEKVGLEPGVLDCDALPFAGAAE